MGGANARDRVLIPGASYYGLALTYRGGWQRFYRYRLCCGKNWWAFVANIRKGAVIERERTPLAPKHRLIPCIQCDVALTGSGHHPRRMLMV